MCLETRSHHYCGHTTIRTEVCQAFHIDQHTSCISRLFRIRTHAKCDIRRIEQNVYTPCHRCHLDIPLREFISQIPKSFSTQQRLNMIANWKAQHRSSQPKQGRKNQVQAELNMNRFRNFTCSRCARLLSFKARMDNGMCCKQGQKEYDFQLEAELAKAKASRHAATLRQLNAPPPSQKPLPDLPLPPSKAQTRTPKGHRDNLHHERVKQIQRQKQQLPRLNTAAIPAVVSSRGRQERVGGQEKKVKSKRLASPSKYLHPGGYQRDTSPVGKGRRQVRFQIPSNEVSQSRLIRRELEDAIGEVERLYRGR